MWHCVLSCSKLYLPDKTVNSIYSDVKTSVDSRSPSQDEGHADRRAAARAGQAIQRRIIKELNAAGFEELRVPHMAVLQFPGPDGVRPGVLAERAGMSKQAMNQLLRSLEGLGYIVRSDAPGEGRARSSA